MDIATKSQRECEQRVAEEYLSSLSDLNCNSKPLINMLTMLAEENIEYAAVIVKVVEQHISKVPPDFKLPILYLIDSIVKNVKSTYVPLFSQCIVNIFCGVFEKVNEKIRERMYALRQTWNEVFSAQKLYALDVKVKRLDNNWPITAKQPSIHVNPIFLKTATQTIPTEMEKILQDKTRELLELKKRKLELELEATKKHLEEQEKQFSKTADSVMPPVEALVAANALQTVAMRPQHPMPPQVMAAAGVMPPGFMGGPQTMGVNTAIRPPAMYHHNIRGFRPNLHPAMLNEQQHQPPQVAGPPPNVAAANNVNKPRVHPVNSALISSVRQRDPRLARQQLHQTSQTPAHTHATSVTMPNAPHASHQQQQQQQQQMVDSAKSGKHERSSSGHKSNRKSPTRTSASSNGSSNRSSGRSSKSSSRDKDRERKQRSESKSSTNSSSSAASLASSLERKKSSSTFASSAAKSSSDSRQLPTTRCDKDAFEIAPLSSAFKRKSTSPSSSPGKNRDSKRSNKSRSARSKTSSRSPSPQAESSSYKDTDLRRMSTSSASSSMITSPEKRPKVGGGDSDQEAVGGHSEDHGSKPAPVDSSSPSSSTATTNIDKTLPLLTESSSGMMMTTMMMDIDLRPHLVVPSSVTSLASAPALPVIASQPCSLDLNPAFSSTNTGTMTSFVRNIEDNIASSSNARNVATTTISSSPKVSFKIQKNFNKLEKSTENLLSAAATPATTASSSSATAAAVVVASTIGSRLPLYPTPNTEVMGDVVMDAKRDSNEDDASKQDGQVSKEQDEDHKKRSLAPVKDEEPVAKKSKSTKLDNLFGTEDVDLRQLMPPMSSAAHEDKAPPPPPFNIGKETNENWDNVKGDQIKSPIKKSSLEDVRAKLAKTAKLNKLSKSDKNSKDFDQRNKLAELQMNEDTQEANDEKIRTMIAQAQELLESNSINQEQYKNLVKTVMSINEVNKLKEAKRRESLNALKDRLNDDGGSNDSERNAAREAILKKRIPKLSKSQLAAANEQLIDSLSGDGSNSNSGGILDEPMRVDVDKQQHDSNDEPPLRNSRREKRGHKSSKWSDRVVEPPPPPPSVMMPAGQLQQQRPWNAMMAAQNKRGPAFRPNAPVNVRPPWPMGNNNSNNMPNQFPKGIPPMGGGHMRGNALPPVVPPSQQQQQQIPSQMVPKPCNSIDNPQEDIVRTITIDGNAKEIRFYDEVAIVFMEVDQPREIGFQNGQRTIYIDNHEPINLQFNHDYKPVLIDGETLNLRFGFPSRELYIDENWYEIYFGGPAIGVPVRNKIHMLKAEGPPPQVNIGPVRRDLVVGKINMIVDAHNVIPLFLDARLQVFKLSDQEHTIQFADNLLTVLLDGTPTRVEYGGLPKSLFLGGKKYFVRFGALPQGVVAGKVQIKGMLYVETSPPTETEIANTSPVAQAALLPTDNDMNTVDIQKRSDNNVPILPAASLSNINIDELFQKLVSTGILGGASGILPAVNNVATQSATAATSSATTTTPANATATTDSLTGDEVMAPAAPAAAQQETIKPINLSKPESIKTRQAAIVATLYSGMQCSSCGVRFPPEQTIKYSQHLDWHFRQNRRERDSSRKSHARKWYYDLNDWIQYEEVEDVEEREKNLLDAQQNDVDLIDDTSNQRSTNSPPPSCPAGSEDVDRACDMCQEKFEQFYNEDQEEWHLRGAMRVEDKIYHPLCYEDYKASLNPPPVKPIEEESTAEEMEEPSLIQIDDDNAVDIVIKVEDDKGAKAEDDDDDVIVLPNEEPSVTEIYDDDDDEYVPANVTREHMGNVIEDEEAGGDLNETTESDVEIQEPHIPFTDLDTYVEKELPPASESSKFMNVKIKEEPKEDEDEDDGFEDVGTVLIAPDEISVHSSEETQTHMIESSTSAMSPLVERPSSTSPSSVHNDENIETTETPATDLNISMDGNFETGDEHNLSAAGPVPTVPLASLVNKIKINITKNTVTTSSTASSNSAAAMLSAANTCKTNSISSLSDQSKGSSSLLGVTAANPIPTISTIPVLCGGGTTISSTQSSSLLGGTMYDEAASSIPSLIGGGVDDNSVSTISVIGSIYGNNGSAAISRPVPPAVTNIPAKPAAAPTPPPPVEETITYELKPALQKASLKKKEKVVCGNETSGLCSIM